MSKSWKGSRGASGLAREPFMMATRMRSSCSAVWTIKASISSWLRMVSPDRCDGGKKLLRKSQFDPVILEPVEQLDIDGLLLVHIVFVFRGVDEVDYLKQVGAAADFFEVGAVEFQPIQAGDGVFDDLR